MKTRKQIELPSDDLAWFYDAYPGGSLSWILAILLHAYRQIHEDTGVIPRKVAKDAAKEARELIEETK